MKDSLVEIQRFRRLPCVFKDDPQINNLANHMLDRLRRNPSPVGHETILAVHPLLSRMCENRGANDRCLVTPACVKRKALCP